MLLCGPAREMLLEKRPRRHADHPALADRPPTRTVRAAVKARQRRARPARRRTAEVIGGRWARRGLSPRPGGGDTAAQPPCRLPFSASDGLCVSVLKTVAEAMWIH